MDSKADIAESTTTAIKTGIYDITGFKTDREPVIHSRYMQFNPKDWD